MVSFRASLGFRLRSLFTGSSGFQFGFGKGFIQGLFECRLGFLEDVLGGFILIFYVFLSFSFMVSLRCFTDLYGTLVVHLGFLIRSSYEDV